MPLPLPCPHLCLQALEQRLRAGATLADIEREFRAPQPAQPPPPPPQQQQRQAAAPAPAPAAPAPPAPPPPPPSPPVVGQSMGMRPRNPLDLIKRSDGSGALLSSKPKYLRTPLTALLEEAQAAKEAGELVWFRVSGHSGVVGHNAPLEWGLAWCVAGRWVGARLPSHRLPSAHPPCTWRCWQLLAPLLLSTQLPPLPSCPSHPLRPQLYAVGDKRELLVSVALEDPANPDSAVTVNMTTTLPQGENVGHALVLLASVPAGRELLPCALLSP